MNLQVGDTGSMFFNKVASKVKVIQIDKGYLGTDVWFDYEENETVRPLIHPSYNVLPKKVIAGPILLPLALLREKGEQIFKKD
jgi:hypothetical protein